MFNRLQPFCNCLYVAMHYSLVTPIQYLHLGIEESVSITVHGPVLFGYEGFGWWRQPHHITLSTPQAQSFVTSISKCVGNYKSSLWRKQEVMQLANVPERIYVLWGEHEEVILLAMLVMTQCIIGRHQHIFLLKKVMSDLLFFLIIAEIFKELIRILCK